MLVAHAFNLYGRFSHGRSSCSFKVFSFSYNERRFTTEKIWILHSNFVFLSLHDRKGAETQRLREQLDFILISNYIIVSLRYRWGRIDVSGLAKSEVAAAHAMNARDGFIMIGKNQGGVVFSKTFIKAIVIIPLLVCLGINVGHTTKTKTHVTVQIVPCCDVVTTFKKFYPLMTYLKESTGFEVELVTPKDYSEFEWAVKNNEIDFVFQDPHTYVVLSKFLDRNSLLRALAWDGKLTQSGLVIARKDSGIRRIEDLKGRNVIFGPKLSVAKWVAAKELLSEHGINIDDNLRSYRNGGCCEDIAFNVYLKAVDAGVICDHFLEQHPDKQNELGIDVRQLTVIGRTKPVPTRVFAARKQLDQKITARINQALLRLDKQNPAHAKILASAELGGFKKSKDADYDSVRLRLGTRPSSGEARR